MGVTDENSEIWALNHSGGVWVDLSQETADLLAQALELCALTDGALDLNRLLGGAGLGGSPPGSTGCPPRRSWTPWSRSLTTPG